MNYQEALKFVTTPQPITEDYFSKYEQAMKILQRGIDRLSAIDNAKPSKAIEALKHIIVHMNLNEYDMKSYGINYAEMTVRNALLRAESEHAELEAMEAFERLLNTPDYELEPIVEGMNEYDVETVRSALIQAEQDRAELATLREQFRTPTADEVCEAINKIIEPYKAIYEEETNLFIYEDDGVVLADESQTDAFLKIALFYKAQEEKK